MATVVADMKSNLATRLIPAVDFVTRDVIIC